MRKSIVKLLLVLSLICLAFVSCKKKGCTDSAAKNYNSEAKKDDNSCTYYTKGTVTKLTIKLFPNGQGGTNWDENSAPDLYFDFISQDYTTLHVSEKHVDIDGEQSWDIPAVVNFNESNGYLWINLFEDDENGDPLVGVIHFDLKSYMQNGGQSTKFPASMLFTEDGCTVEVFVTWE